MSRYPGILNLSLLNPYKDRKIKTVSDKLKTVITMYKHRGFSITSILGDNEFEPLRPYYPMINTAAADEHVPDVERAIRTIKERTRATYNVLPFRFIPRIMLVHMVKNAVLWLNAFPADDGVSDEHSPRYFLTGRELTYDKHANIEFGTYVQTHEEHDNSMGPRTLGAICLGPTGNAQGSHWFLSLTSGFRTTRRVWTELPLPTNVKDRIDQMGRDQNMPTTLTYANRKGEEIIETIHDYDDDGTDLDDSTVGSLETEDDEGSTRNCQYYVLI